MTAEKPYVVCAASDAEQTLGDSARRYYATCLEACNAFAKSQAPYKQILFDDGCEVRWLNAREQRLLHKVCDLLGLQVEEVA
jgi:hypothetical protein